MMPGIFLPAEIGARDTGTGSYELAEGSDRGRVEYGIKSEIYSNMNYSRSNLERNSLYDNAN